MGIVSVGVQNRCRRGCYKGVCEKSRNGKSRDVDGTVRVKGKMLLDGFGRCV